MPYRETLISKKPLPIEPELRHTYVKLFCSHRDSDDGNTVRRPLAIRWRLRKSRHFALCKKQNACRGVEMVFVLNRKRVEPLLIEMHSPVDLQ